MKRNYQKLLSFAVCSLLCTGLSAQSWKNDAVKFLNNGEFEKVENIINGLSKKEKKQYPVLIDSLQTMMQRIRNDFRYTPEEGKKLLLEKVPGATDNQIAEWKDKKYLETRVIDGQEWWFRKSIRNFSLLNKELYAEQIKTDRAKDYADVHKIVANILSQKRDENNVCDWKTVEMTYFLEVPANEVPAGEIIRAWLPFPYDNGRQRNFNLTYSSSPVTHSQGSVHHTVYMEQKAEKNKPTRFEIKFSYEVGAQVFSKADILRNLKPYDRTTENYKKNTCQVLPHILVNKKYLDLALSIVGKEKNPVKQASMIYDWISANYPWAGALDYSTIPSMPEYVLNINHGDCGQVALLYISLLRNLGIPARWESGWEFTETSTGWHDWLEVYFEGTGWVPCDMSRGRTTYKQPFADFFKSSIDGYRFATNEGINGVFSPAKKYLRCETVDFQAGEVEWKKANITKYKSNLIVNKITPIK
ncbi:MAG: hypothetical protein IIU72_00400 [Muribaculaceae bacterium]|nr:hypothetical protein [Muribaculaceae bacterium]